MRHLIYSSSILLLTLAALLSGGCKKDKADNMLKIGGVALTDISAAGAEKTIAITSNAPWSVSGATDWCKVEPQSGKGDETVVVTITENDTPDKRSAELTVTANGVDPVRIEVSQRFNVLIKIEDNNLRKWLDTEFADGKGLLDDVSGITRINVPAEVTPTVESLEGIENFYNLEEFNFDAKRGVTTDVKPFDFSVFPKLTALTFSHTPITSFSTKGMARLTFLNISQNPNLSDVDLTGLSDKLETIFCNDTAIGPELDITPFPNLTGLICNNTKITTLYVWWNPDGEIPEQFSTGIFGVPDEINFVKK